VLVLASCGTTTEKITTPTEVKGTVSQSTTATTTTSKTTTTTPATTADTPKYGGMVNVIREIEPTYFDDTGILLASRMAAVA
jgi:hypothetical protein